MNGREGLTSTQDSLTSLLTLQLSLQRTFSGAKYLQRWNTNCARSPLSSSTQSKQLKETVTSLPPGPAKTQRFAQRLAGRLDHLHRYPGMGSFPQHHRTTRLWSPSLPHHVATASPHPHAGPVFWRAAVTSGSCHPPPSQSWPQLLCVLNSAPPRRVPGAAGSRLHR